MRFEDYAAGRKGSTTAGFGTVGTGLFGSTAASNAGTSLFGGAVASKPSAFGGTRCFFYKKPVYKKPDAGASKRLRNFQYWIFLLKKIKKLVLLKSLEKKDTAG